jgi:hypothetical protein
MNKNLFSKYVNSLQKDGILGASQKVSLWFMRKLGVESADAIIHKRKIQISNKLDQIYNSTVQHGPFKGLKLSAGAWWGMTDRGSMLLGLYEKEVLDSLKSIPKKYTNFIDLGAADGYYGIGVLVNDLFHKSICYEISESGRQTIKNNAVLNNVSKRVDIRGIATKNFFNEIPSDILSQSVLLIDIEGAEFELVDVKTFEAFRDSIIFIELHNWFFVDGDQRLQKLKDDSFVTHVITELTMGSRDLSSFPELKKMNDTDRWLICAEGRGELMTWLRFDPKSSV